MLVWFAENYRQIGTRIQTNALHHALLFHGTHGIGKRNFTDLIASRLLCLRPIDNEPCGTCQACKLLNAGSHPDLHVIQSDKSIGVDLIRNAISKLSGTAQLSGNKVLVMYAAGSMTEAAANALLKTLEEPTSSTYILLVSDDIHTMLPTILSRCEKHLLPSPTAEQCNQWLKENDMNQVDSQTLALFNNAPFRIQMALADDSILAYDDFKLAITSLKKGETHHVALAEKWQKQGENVISYAQYMLLEDVKEGHKTDQVLDFLQQCQHFRRKMTQTGINSQLFMANFLSSFIQIKP